MVTFRPDVRVESQGEIVLDRPLTPAARAWIEANLE